MSSSFKPRHVSSDVISRWPEMALALWRKSFSQQAALLLAAALVSKLFPAWSSLIGFLIAPSLFVVSFVAVQMADEGKASWLGIVNGAWRGTLRAGAITLQFAAGFAAVMAVLHSIASVFTVDRSPATELASASGTTLNKLATNHAAGPMSEGLFSEFVFFCASWAGEVVAMVFLGLFVVAIYQAVLGIILHALYGMDARMSRLYGWQAWQINAESMKIAVIEAQPRFFLYLASGVLAIICSFQSVYLSPAGLLLATYIPCLAYVAFRSIFLGKHRNTPVAIHEAAVSNYALALADRRSVYDVRS